MSAFQLRKDGTLAEIGDDGSVIGVVQPMAALTNQVDEDEPGPARAPQSAAKAAPAKPLSPRDVVKAAKTRAKELRAEIKRLESAKRELAQMERLIAAANGRALAPVRELKRAAN